MIQLQTYSINNLLLTNEIVTSYVDNFWNDVFTPLTSNNKDKHLLILVKVHYTCQRHKDKLMKKGMN
jgi:hypothetical protein